MKITEMLLSPNKYSRPQTALKEVTKIAVHYVGNPNTTGLANRNFFEGLKDQIPDATNKWCLNKDGSYLLYKGKKVALRWVSSHFVIGLEGEIIQCLPLNEWSYCTNQANGYSISIECCHPDITGEFTEATEKSCAELCAYLCEKFKLTTDDIIRHYDVTGKQCPLYWSPTKNQSVAIANGRFTAFKEKVKGYLNNGYEAEIEAERSDFTPYTVKIVTDKLNVRKSPGTSSEIVTVVKKGYKYTIVDEARVGEVPWGKLKSGAGWISLLSKYAVKC